MIVSGTAAMAAAWMCVFLSVAPAVRAEPEGGGASRAMLHGGMEAGEAMGVSSAGVLVRHLGVEYVLGWDRVARVMGPLGDEAAHHEELARLAWRARVRLERGDAVSAEPLYEDLFQRIGRPGGPTGPTALSICEGLLRCRLWRGAHASALAPWLRWVRLSHESGDVPRVDPSDPAARPRVWTIALLPIFDEPTGLVASLPPIWLAGPSVRAIVVGAGATVDEGEGPGAERARALGALYLAAARFEGGDRRPLVPVSGPVADDPGVRLVAEIVHARAGDAGQREAARQALRARLAGEPPAWQEAWCRVGLGRSLLLEPDADTVLSGVVQLMHLPARFGDEQPYLTGVALAESAVALARLGDTESAGVLERLLAQRYSGHPAIEWAELSRTPGRVGEAAPEAEPSEPRP